MRGLTGALLALDNLSAGIVQRVHAGLVGLDVVDDHLQFGQLDLDDLRVTVDWFERVQGLVRPVNPDEELAKGMLELTEAQEGVLKLLLAHHNGLVEVLPPPVDVGQWFLDGAGLVR